MDASCFCAKLSQDRVTDLSKEQVDVLLKSLRSLQQSGVIVNVGGNLQASQTLLKETQPAVPLARGRLDEQLLTKLKDSFPDRSLEQTLERVGAQQPHRNNLLLPLSQDPANDLRLDSPTLMYLEYVSWQRNAQNACLAKRILCLALFRAHPRGASLEDLTQSIQRSQVVREESLEIQGKLTNMLRIGSRWDRMVQSCNTVGIICVLGQSSQWVQANEVTWTTALQSLFQTSDIQERAGRYNVDVEAALKYANSGFGSKTAPRSRGGPFSSGPLRPTIQLTSSSVCSNGVQVRLLSHSSVSSDASLLLSLLFHLGGADVPQTLLCRGGSSLSRWDGNGGKSTKTPEQSGIDKRITELLSCRHRFDAATTELVQANKIRICDHLFSITEGSGDALADTDNIDWRAQTLAMLAHTFPRDNYLEPRFGELGRCQIPIMRHVFREVGLEEIQNMPLATQVDLSNTLIAATFFVDVEWKQNCLDKIPLVDKEVELQTATRHVTLARIRGSNAQLNDVKFQIGDPVYLPTGPRLNARLGELDLAAAKSFAQIEEFVNAERILQDWNPINKQDPSLMEQMVDYQKSIQLAKISQYKGNFDDSLRHLKPAVALSPHVPGSKRIDLTCTLCDVHCELNRAFEAESILREEIKDGSHTVADTTRLQICLAESFLQRFDIDNAVSALGSWYYANEASLRGLPKFGQLRVYILLARIAHIRQNWPLASEYWSQALARTRDFPLISGFTPAVVLASMTHVLEEQIRQAPTQSLRSELQDLKEKNLRQLQSFAAHTKSNSGKYWIAGVGSYWCLYVMASLRRLSVDSPQL